MNKFKKILSKIKNNKLFKVFKDAFFEIKKIVINTLLVTKLNNDENKYLTIKINKIRMLSIMLFIIMGIYFVTSIILNMESHKYIDQNIVSKWDNTEMNQLSIFFSKDCNVKKDICENLKEICCEKGYDTKASYCYYTKKIINKDEYLLEHNVIVVNSDFFYYHPLELLSGTYFSENDINDNYCLIDEYTAWNIWGARQNVEGSELIIDDQKYYVKGVYRHPDGEVYEKAGMKKETIILKYNDAMDDEEPIECVEIMLPERFKNEGILSLNEALSNSIDDKFCENTLYGNEYYKITDNSKRYNLAGYCNLIKERNNDLIRSDYIRFPYWENVAKVSQSKILWAFCLKYISVLLGLVLLLYMFYRIFLQRHAFIEGS